MIWLVLGLALWVGGHGFRRFAPGPRAAMQDRMGDASKGVVAAILALSVVLMILGYRWSALVPVWYPPAWTIHLNNLLMVISVVLLGVGESKSRLRGKLRHPMLIGFALWCVAHLLVNGDLTSIVMWGVLLLWSVGEIRVINAKEPLPPPYEGGSVAGDIRLAVICLVVFAVIVAIHAWLGYWPFPQ